MSDWAPYMTGLPNVVIKELEINYNTDKIVAATFGRGVWESDLKNISTNLNPELNELFEIYPNPTEGNIVISGIKSNNAKINIYNSTGQKIFSCNHKKNIHLDHLKKGFYMIEIISDKIKYGSQKLIIK